jgi:peptidoglycan endopeptidase LytE
LKKQVVTTVTLAAIASGTYAAGAYASTYTVQQGDTLYAIATKHNTNVMDLKKANNLLSDLILVNQTLQIPDTTSATAPAPAASTAATYTVVSGDTLSGIAQNHNIALSDLRQWNNLSGDLIFPGQVLNVAGGSSSQPAASPSPAAPASSSNYTIQRGDTLSKIASLFGTTVSALKQLNGLSSDLIYAGDSLKVSGTASATPAATAPAPAAPASNSSTYTIQSGDTLSKIASQFGTTVANLMQLNGLSSSFIYVGQTLTVAGQAKVTPAALPIVPASSKVSTSADTSNTSVAAEVTLIAKSLVGSRYIWGGNTTAGFDCSGFIYYVYNKAGLSIGRYSAQGYADRSYEVSNPVPGDLVFFKDTYQPGISHVGIYLGGGQFIQAADEIHGVIISSLSNVYYKQHFDHFARFY